MRHGGTAPKKADAHPAILVAGTNQTSTRPKARWLSVLQSSTLRQRSLPERGETASLARWSAAEQSALLRLEETPSLISVQHQKLYTFKRRRKKIEKSLHMQQMC